MTEHRCFLSASPPRPRPRRSPRDRAAWLVAVLTLAIASSSCEDLGTDSGTPDDLPAVGGRWNGSYVVGEETFAASFILSQDDVVVTGNASIDVLLPTSPLEAAIDRAGRLVVLIENDCEDWLGTLEISSNGRTMSGLLQVDRLQCPTGTNDIGTLTLTR